MTDVKLPSTSIRVMPSFHEADPMNVVWHGNYLKYFERAREALFREIGYDYRAMAESGYMFPIVNVEVKYRAPMLVETPATVTARFVEIENRIVIDYQVIDEATNKCLTTGRTVQMTVNAQTRTGEFTSPKILFEKLGLPYPWE